MGSNRSGRHDAARRALDALRRIVQTIRESSRLAEQQVGIGGAQLFVLETLAASQPLSLNDLAARTRTHQSSVSVVVSRLVDGGLVARGRADGDARRLELTLTPRGRRLIGRAPRAPQQQMVHALERMPRTTQRVLARGLDELARSMRASRRQPPMFFVDGHRRRKESGQ